MEFGVPEAMWLIEVKDFPVVVTMDLHGGSQHAVIDDTSKKFWMICSKDRIKLPTSWWNPLIPPGFIIGQGWL